MLRITTITQLAAAPLHLLIGEFGSYGHELHDMALGHDASSVDADDADPKSMGHAVTLPRDLHTFTEVRGVVEELAEKVAARLRRAGYGGTTIHVTVRFRDFTSRGEQVTIPDATADGLRIVREVMRILERWNRLPPVRLVGVSVSNLIGAHLTQASLFPKQERWRAATNAMDAANNRYGDWTVQRASLLRTERVAREVAAAFQSTAHLKSAR